ncbi:hypothetical protein HDU76_000347 [Blyttiomyces sp. JEL0837]|nr:hypothetical protein HDU76_000347 [Blyttiomyces sp. JEL0837]
MEDLSQANTQNDAFPMPGARKLLSSHSLTTIPHTSPPPRSPPQSRPVKVEDVNDDKSDQSSESDSSESDDGIDEDEIAEIRRSLHVERKPAPPAMPPPSSLTARLASTELSPPPPSATFPPTTRPPPTSYTAFPTIKSLVPQHQSKSFQDQSQDFGHQIISGASMAAGTIFNAINVMATEAVSLPNKINNIFQPKSNKVVVAQRNLSLEKAGMEPTVVVRIGRYLPYRDVVKFSRVCRLWKNSLEDMKSANEIHVQVICDGSDANAKVETLTLYWEDYYSIEMGTRIVILRPLANNLVLSPENFTGLRFLVANSVSKRVLHAQTLEVMSLRQRSPNLFHSHTLPTGDPSVVWIQEEPLVKDILARSVRPSQIGALSCLSTNFILRKSPLTSAILELNIPAVSPVTRTVELLKGKIVAKIDSKNIAQYNRRRRSSVTSPAFSDEVLPIAIDTDQSSWREQGLDFSDVPRYIGSNLSSMQTLKNRTTSSLYSEVRHQMLVALVENTVLKPWPDQLYQVLEPSTDSPLLREILSCPAMSIPLAFYPLFEIMAGGEDKVRHALNLWRAVENRVEILVAIDAVQSDLLNYAIAEAAAQSQLQLSIPGLSNMPGLSLQLPNLTLGAGEPVQVPITMRENDPFASDRTPGTRSRSPSPTRKSLDPTSPVNPTANPPPRSGARTPEPFEVSTPTRPRSQQLIPPSNNPGTSTPNANSTPSTLPPTPSPQFSPPPPPQAVLQPPRPQFDIPAAQAAARQRLIKIQAYCMEACKHLLEVKGMECYVRITGYEGIIPFGTEGTKIEEEIAANELRLKQKMKIVKNVPPPPTTFSITAASKVFAAVPTSKGFVPTASLTPASNFRNRVAEVKEEPPVRRGSETRSGGGLLNLKTPSNAASGASPSTNTGLALANGLKKSLGNLYNNMNGKENHVSHHHQHKHHHGHHHHKAVKGGADAVRLYEHLRTTIVQVLIEATRFDGEVVL